LQLRLAAQLHTAPRSGREALPKDTPAQSAGAGSGRCGPPAVRPAGWRPHGAGPDGRRDGLQTTEGAVHV